MNEFCLLERNIKIISYEATPTNVDRERAMVLLGLSFSLLKQVPLGSQRGLYAGKGIMHGVKVTFSNKKLVFLF